jgi:hypothetical protein
MIKKLFFIAALLMPGLAYGGPSANLSVQIVPAGSVTGSILPFLPPGTTQWVYMGGDEFNGSSLNFAFWNATPLDGSLVDGQGCQVLSSITESGGSLSIVGVDPVHCAHQPPYPANGVCGSPCAGGEITSNNPPGIPGGFGPGYYEARIFNQAGYAAFWTGNNWGSCASPPPAIVTGGAENDIMEGSGTYQNNTHWGGYGACHMSNPQTGLGPVNDGYHLLGLRWDPTDGFRYYLDGRQTQYIAGPVSSMVGGTNDVKFTAFAYSDGGAPILVDWFRFFRAQ